MSPNAICSREANGCVPGSACPTYRALPNNYPTVIQKYTSRRWILGYMMILGFLLVQTMQNSMAFAIVCMTGTISTTDTGNLSYTANNSFINVSTTEKASQFEFDFSSETQGLLISSAYYAAIPAPMFGSICSRRFGPKRVMLICMFLGGTLMALLPSAARTNVYLAVACRIIMGLFVHPVANVSLDFWLHWAPANEKAQLVAYSFSGFNMANVVVFALSGFLCLIPFDNGWPFIFYVFGGITLLWCVVWHFIIHETPETHPSITEDEKLYIQLKRSNVADNNKNRTIPWKSIFLSKGVWAYLFVMLCHNVNSSILFSYLPMYMATVLNFDVDENGLLSSLPYITRVLATFLLGYVSVKLLKVISVTNTRKLIQVGGFTGATCLAIGLSYLQEGQEYIAVALFAMATPFQASTVNSAMVTPLDMAPQYASVISSFGMAIAITASIGAPMTVSYIIPQRTRQQWRYVFYMNAGFFVCGALGFLLFGSGELQPWADNSVQHDIHEPKRKKSEINLAYISDVDEVTHM